MAGGRSSVVPSGIAAGDAEGAVLDGTTGVAVTVRRAILAPNREMPGPLY
jgi:hypothetical protein